MLKKKLIIILILSFACIATALADVKDNESVVYIKLDKTQFRQNEKILLKIYVKNSSVNKKKFYVYDSDKEISYTTFQPMIRDLSGREPAIKVPYILEGIRANQQIAGLKRRMIELGHDEEFVYSVDLMKIYDLKPGIEYRVKSCFVPDFSKKEIFVSENELFFRISHEYFPEKGRMYHKTKKQEYVSPSEIILLALYAEKNMNWADFFKYIELESYIVSFPDYHREYDSADRFGRERVLNDFKKFLMRRRTDYLIRYEIIDEMIDNNLKMAYVDVIVDRYGARITDRYKYRYKLCEKEQKWFILKLDATVMRGKNDD